MGDVTGKKIIVGITGGIAAYKACTLVSRLLHSGAEVRVVMTASAGRFVSPHTFRSLAKGYVYDDMWDVTSVPDKILHIDLARWADLIMVAPATAQTIAKVAHGFADNLLTLTILASTQETPVLFVPAMNTCMLENPITQSNFDILKRYGRYHFTETREGTLACQEVGKGKIASSDEVLEAIRNLLG